MRRFDTTWRVACATLMTIWLPVAIVACGGGGGSSAPAAPPPVESAPPPVTVSAVQLDAQPMSLSASPGESVSFSVHASGTAPFSYQWFRSGIAIPGGTTSTLKLAAVRYADDASAYTVEVGNAAGTVRSQAAILSLKPAASPTLVDACTEITRPGSYRLSRDLSAGPTATCIAIHDVQDVQLDCDGHTISNGLGRGALDLRKVSNFSIRNCAITTFVLNINDSDNGSVSRNTVLPVIAVAPFSAFNVYHSKAIVFDGNTITGTLQQFYGVGNTVSNNVFTTPGTASAPAGNVLSNWGRHDRIIGNIIDGGWTGKSGEQLGSDDAQVENNTIRNVWDCGIEWLGSLTHVSIRANHIANASFCGIGGWYYAGLSDSVIANNTVEQSAEMITIFRSYGLRPAGTDSDGALPADTGVVFRNNQFVGNIFTRPTGKGSLVFLLNYNMGLPGVSISPGERPLTPADYQIVNNVFKDNQFPAGTDGPWFGDAPFIPGAIVDGGGNRCTPRSEPGYPLKCQ
jgi:hypothetical protein